MATPTKRKFVDEQLVVDGYIHSVSPIKTSRNGSHFFNAKVQTEAGYEHLVSWKAEAHQSFKDMEQARTPVHLDNLQTIPSYLKPGTFDYKFGPRSQIVKPRQKLTFSSKSPEPIQKDKTLEEVLASSSTFEKVNIIAKVIQVSSPVPVSEKLTKLSLRVADNTAKMQMVVWNNHIDEITIEKCYRMKNITVRQFSNEKTLSSNPDSIFEACEELEDVVTDNENIETISAIDMVHVMSGKFCIYCNTEMVANEAVPTVRCNSCNRKFKTVSLRKQTTATITCEGKDFLIKNTLLCHNIADLEEMSTDELEDHLLLNMSAVISDRSVVKLVLK